MCDIVVSVYYRPPKQALGGAFFRKSGKSIMLAGLDTHGGLQSP